MEVGSYTTAVYDYIPPNHHCTHACSSLHTAAVGCSSSRQSGTVGCPYFGRVRAGAICGVWLKATQERQADAWAPRPSVSAMPASAGSPQNQRMTGDSISIRPPLAVSSRRLDPVRSCCARRM